MDMTGEADERSSGPRALGAGARGVARLVIVWGPRDHSSGGARWEASSCGGEGLDGGTGGRG
eukprot:COSAG06_NODE_2431_length_6889_cov_345.528424_1_plen_61_part_10